MVLSPQEATTLLRVVDAYDLRSRTAHRGELHGLESTFGYTYMPTFWTEDDPWRFSVQFLFTMSLTVAKLLRSIADNSVEFPRVAAS